MKQIERMDFLKHPSHPPNPLKKYPYQSVKSVEKTSCPFVLFVVKKSVNGYVIFLRFLRDKTNNFY